MSDVSGGTQDGVGLHRSAMKCARLGQVKCNIPSRLSASGPLAGEADEAGAACVIWCSLVPHRGWNASDGASATAEEQDGHAETSAAGGGGCLAARNRLTYPYDITAVLEDTRGKL